jgi:hypothetical protein
VSEIQGPVEVTVRPIQKGEQAPFFELATVEEWSVSFMRGSRRMTGRFLFHPRNLFVAKRSTCRNVCGRQREATREKVEGAQVGTRAKADTQARR